MAEVLVPTSGASQEAIPPVLKEDAMLKKTLTAAVTFANPPGSDRTNRRLVEVMFKNALTAVALVIGLTTIPMITRAQDNTDTTVWSTNGTWQVRIDHTLYDTCFLIGYYPSSGTVLRIGLGYGQQGYMMIANAAWQSLYDGKVVPMQLNIGGKNWSGAAEAKTFSNTPALWIPIDLRLITDMAKASGNDLTIYYQGAVVGMFNLGQTRTAVQSLHSCVAASAANRANSTGNGADPFSSPAARPIARDPFNR
jgi:hypothetical protein